jgi:hypothetical protein
MNAAISALIALAVLAGLAGSAAAIDAKTFFEQQDRSRF